MLFIPEHLDVLQATLRSEIPQGPVGMAPMDWATCVGYEAAAGTLSEVALCREQVRHYCQDLSQTPEDCFVTIMAWGGTALWLRFRRMIWEAKGWWLDIVTSLRRNDLSRAEAYQSLWELKKIDRLPGLGPAFFTKLIFFMLPAGNGYVMDQWLAKSVNLLRGERVVQMVGDNVSSRAKTQ